MEEKVSSGRPTSSLVGYVTPSSAKRNPITMNSEEEELEGNGLEDHEVFALLTEKIDEFLFEARHQMRWSSKLGSIASGMSISAGFVKSLSPGARTAYEMLVSTKFLDMTTTAEGILRVIRKVHWVAAGQLVAAAIIHTIQKSERIDRDCVDLLQSINTASKSLKKLRMPYISEEVRSTVTEARNLMAKSAACCFYILSSNRYHMLFFSSENDNQIARSRDQLEMLQRQLQTQLLVDIYSQRYDMSGGCHCTRTSRIDETSKFSFIPLRIFWAAAGLLVAAAIILTILKAGRIDRDCLELGQSINTVSKSLKKLSMPYIPEEVRSTATEARNLMAKSAACCFCTLSSKRYHIGCFFPQNTRRRLQGVGIS